MSRTGVTYTDVSLAAEKLVQQRLPPTIERIRALLGTGSNTTVSKYLMEWKTQQIKKRIETPLTMALPTDSLNQAVTQVWEKLQVENQAKLETIEEEAKYKIQLAQEEKEQALDELLRVKEDNQQLRALLKDMREQNEVFAKEQIQHNQTLAVLEEKCKIVEETAKTFQQFSNQTLASLETKYQQVVSQYETQLVQNKVFYTKELSQMKETAEKQRHDHIIEIDHLKTANQKLQMQLTEKNKIQHELSSRVGQLSSHLQNQDGTMLELLASIQKNEKHAEAIKVDIINNIDETVQSALEKQTKIVLSVFQQKISELKKPVKVK